MTEEEALAVTSNAGSPYVYDNTRELRAQCLQSALQNHPHSDTYAIMREAKQFWVFVDTGE